MKRSILLGAAVAASLIFLNCGMPMTGNDAGTGGGTGGGATGGGTGGGATGGGATGGGATGGGATGGGATGGGTGGSNCATLDFSQAPVLDVGYSPATMNSDPNTQLIKGMPSATMGKFDFLRVEFWYFGSMMNPTVPFTVNLADTTGYNACFGCTLIQQACDNMGGNCAKLFFATSGSMTFTAATKVASAGRFEGSATNLHFAEWRYGMGVDMPVANGSCIEIPNLTWAGSWPLVAPGDGGTDAGMNTDAGTDAGMMTTDAGDPDAGMTTDAGNPDAGDGG
jgi:hypothetical protein